MESLENIKDIFCKTFLIIAWLFHTDVQILLFVLKQPNLKLSNATGLKICGLVNVRIA